MRRVKERWNVEAPEYNRMSVQMLKDNAARFRKEPEIEGLILVRERTVREPSAVVNVHDEVANDDEQPRLIDDGSDNEVNGDVVREGVKEYDMLDDPAIELEEEDAGKGICKAAKYIGKDNAE